MTAEQGASDPEIPEQLDDARDAGGTGGGTHSATSDSPAKSEEKATGSVVDAEAGHQADKPAVEGDPQEAGSQYDGPPPPSDIE